MLRRNPVSRKPNRRWRGPPDAQRVATWRKALIARHGFPAHVSSGYIAGCRRTGEWWRGVDLRHADDAQVAHAWRLAWLNPVADAG